MLRQQRHSPYVEKGAATQQLLGWLVLHQYLLFIVSDTGMYQVGDTGRQLELPTAPDR